MKSRTFIRTLASFPGRSHLQFLQYAKRRGKAGLGERVTCMTSGRHEGRQRWDSAQYWMTAVLMCLLNVTVSSSWTRYYKKDLKIPSSGPLSTYMSSWCHARDSFSQAGLPPPFLHTAETGDGNGLGTRLMSWWMFDFSCLVKITFSRKDQLMFSKLLNIDQCLVFSKDRLMFSKDRWMFSKDRCLAKIDQCLVKIDV